MEKIFGSGRHPRATQSERLVHLFVLGRAIDPRINVFRSIVTWKTLLFQSVPNVETASSPDSELRMRSGFGSLSFL